VEVTKKDLFWNYGATFMRVASALLIFPLILRFLPAYDVGLWTIIIALNSIIYLLDFGFFQTFSRAVTYIYSGAQSLQKKGFDSVVESQEINYSLLKGLIGAMRNFYGLLSLLLLLLLATVGSIYIEALLKGYEGEPLVARIAWYGYGLMLAFQFFTYYYDAALVGRGMIKRSRQIIVVSQSLHIVVSSLLLLGGVGILSMLVGQFAATLLNRFLARRAFFDPNTKRELGGVKGERTFPIIWKLFYTAGRNGLASLSQIFSNRFLALFGALYIPLEVMASYGLSKQIVDITTTLSLVWFSTHYPKLTGEQLRRSIGSVREIFVTSQIVVISTFILAAVATAFFGEWLLSLIGSSTHLISSPLLAILFLASLLEALTQLSTSLLMSRNEVPHYLAQSLTAAVTVILLLLSLHHLKWEVWALVMVPFAVQMLYQHWKWNFKVMGELKIGLNDYLDGVKSLYKAIPIFNHNK